MVAGVNSSGSGLLNDFVESFESAWARDGYADPMKHLPDRAHPDFLEILCEIVRVDLECSNNRGIRRRLEEYRERFPELFADEAALESAAFEEYRLRREAGEPVRLSEYRARFGIDCRGWPLSAEEFAVEESSATRSELAIDQERPDDDRARFLDELYQSDPPTANRVKRALAAMPQAGGRFLDFHLERELGRGAFGRVYLAKQRGLADRPVALKIAPDVGGETRALARLRHTNVVPIYSVHRSGPFQAVCMPYLGSTTLADVLTDLKSRQNLPESGDDLLDSVAASRSRSRSEDRSDLASRETSPTEPPLDRSMCFEETSGPLDRIRGLTYVNAVLWLGARIAAGLAHAHERGILHRDIKPANVLLTDDGEPILLDFHLAEDSVVQVRSAALVGGTLPYMSPEHLTAYLGGAAAVDSRSDVYSLGVLLHELISRTHPFPIRRGASREIVPRMIEDRRVVPKLRAANPAASPAVESILMKCLEFKPDNRYASARRLQEDLENQLENRPLKHAPEPSLRERFSKWTKRHPRLTSSTSVGLIALLTIAIASAAWLSARARVERLEAEAALVVLREDLRRAHGELGFANAPRSVVEEGRTLCQSVSDRYEAELGPAAAARSRLLRPLTPDSRNEAMRLIGESLFLLARAEAGIARELTDLSAREGSIRKAASLNSKAGAFLGGDDPPAPVLRFASELAREEGRTDEAERLLARANLAADPPDLRLITIGEKLDHSRFSVAVELAREAARAEPSNFVTWLLLGNCQVATGKLRDAVASYDVAAALNPRNEWTHFFRGLTSLELKDYRVAETSFSQTIAIRPDSTEARINRAIARLALDEFAGALEDVESALEKPNAPTRLFFIKERAERGLGDHVAASRSRAEGLRLEPSDELSWIARGLARLPRDASGALRDFEEALRVNPRSRSALQNSASVLASLPGNTEAAVRTLDRAIGFYPRSAAAVAGRGVLLARLGRREAALKDAERALELDRSASSKYQVAGILALASKSEPEDKSRALALLSSAFRDDPATMDLITRDTDLDPIRNDPRFQELVQAFGITRRAEKVRDPRWKFLEELR